MCGPNSLAEHRSPLMSSQEWWTTYQSWSMTSLIRSFWDPLAWAQVRGSHHPSYECFMTGSPDDQVEVVHDDDTSLISRPQLWLGQLHEWWKYHEDVHRQIEHKHMKLELCQHRDLFSSLLLVIILTSLIPLCSSTISSFYNIIYVATWNITYISRVNFVPYANNKKDVWYTYVSLPLHKRWATLLYKISPMHGNFFWTHLDPLNWISF
jgi:hypothetical protein